MYNPNAYEEMQFNDYLRAVMNGESNIEKAKIDLALRCDFNCEDAFRIFEQDGRGFITEDDLRYGLCLLGITPTNEDLRLLMKRFDLRKEGALSYGDFFDMLVPYEKDYRLMVEERPPNSCCPCRCLDLLSFVTRTYLKNVLSLIIETENRLNIMKKGYTTLRIKLPEIFGMIDYLRCGYFLNENFVGYLKRNGIYNCTKDADLTFIRLDRKRNGQIEQAEVRDELEAVY